MPTSQQFQLTKIVDLILSFDPQSVLDIGPGFGKYGFLCREYLELFRLDHGSYGKFTKKIDAIEVFPEYITPVHRFIYNDIHIGDARNVVPTLKHNYDLTLLIDVLEHFEMKDGATLIQEILKKSRCVLISAPKDIGHQGEEFGNPHEAHLAQWTPKDMFKIAPGFVIPDRESHLVFLGDKTAVEKLRPRFRPNFLKLAAKSFLNAGF